MLFIGYKLYQALPLKFSCYPLKRRKCIERDDLQFIFGIPTINRKNENYLYDTIDSLLNGLNNFETKREPCF